MEKTKDYIMNFMRENRRVQSAFLKVAFRHEPDFDRALSSLIDDNKLEEKHENKIKFVMLGPAI